jgi:hypothetical protein
MQAFFCLFFVQKAGAKVSGPNVKNMDIVASRMRYGHEIDEPEKICILHPVKSSNERCKEIGVGPFAQTIPS